MLVSFFILMVMCTLIIGIPCLDRYHANNDKVSRRKHMTQKDLEKTLTEIKEIQEENPFNKGPHVVHTYEKCYKDKGGNE